MSRAGRQLPKHGGQLRLHIRDVRDAWTSLTPKPREVYVVAGGTRVLVYMQPSKVGQSALVGTFSCHIGLIDFAEAVECAANELLESMGLPANCGPTHDDARAA